MNWVERRRSALETNMTRWGGWDTGAPASQRSAGVHGNDLLGVVARSQGAELGPLELDVLSWLTARWFELGRHPQGFLRCTLYELGFDLYGRKPSGKEVRLLRRAIENLAGALITLGGFNAHTGELKPKLASMVHLVESAVWGENLEYEVPTRGHAAEIGGLRGSTYEIKLATWLVQQLQSKYVTYLDWRKQRMLDGLAKRLWVYLEAERYKLVGDGREQAYIVLGPKAYTALGVHHGRERDRRSALKRAGTRICEVDDHYEGVLVERTPVNRAAWRLVVTRVADVERREVRAAIHQSLEAAKANSGL